MIEILYIASIAGFAISTAVHLLTFAGIDPFKYCPQLWALHLILLLIWFPLFFIRASRGTFWQLISNYCPRWTRNLLIGLFPYILFNFIFTIFVLNGAGFAEEHNGQKGIYNKGKLRRPLTDDEYERYRAHTPRAFSGHWLFFYGAAAAFAYGKKKAPPADRT